MSFVSWFINYLSWWHVPALLAWIGGVISLSKNAPYLAYPSLYDPDRDYDKLVRNTRIAMFCLVACELFLVLGA